MRASRLRHRGKYLAFDVSIVGGFIAVTTLLLRMVHGAFDKEFAYSALTGTLGAVLGVAIAVVITPFTAEARAMVEPHQRARRSCRRVRHQRSR